MGVRLNLLIFASATCFIQGEISAHSGRTNEHDCHNVTKTNEYHCHDEDLKYDLNQFGNWIDQDGDCQDTRQEVLIEESLIEVTFKTSKNCEVIAGLWLDLYSGLTYRDPRSLDVDHVVPLKEVYDSGANHWSRQKRIQYFNDLSFKDHLVAVHKSINRSKGSKGPDEWLPPDENYWDSYVGNWNFIKKKWNLNLLVYIPNPE